MTYRFVRYDTECPSAWACPARNGQISVLRSTIAFGSCVLSVGRGHMSLGRLVDGRQTQATRHSLAIMKVIPVAHTGQDPFILRRH